MKKTAQQPHLLPLPNDLPTFQTALQNFEHLPDYLYGALEAAASKCRDYKDAEFPKTKFDAHVAAAMFRAQSIKYLRDKGIDAREDGCYWAFNNLPFAGISFYYKNQHVRILKGRDGVLPGCGRSGTKKKFYGQVPTKYLVGNKPMRSDANFVVLWDFATGYALEKLWLVLPAKGGARSDDVSAYWQEALPHPVATHSPKPETSPSDDGLDNMIRPKTDVPEIAKGKSNAR